MEKQHCDNVHICLIGTNHFQHRLFITSLKQIHDCRCRYSTAASLSALQVECSPPSEKRYLVYLDCYNLNQIDILSLLTRARQKIPTDHLLALFNLNHTAEVERDALDTGAMGFFYPEESPSDFCEGTKAMLRGEIRLSREKMTDVILSRTTSNHAHRPKPKENSANLSKREIEILTVLSTGASNKAIGEALCISHHTVRTHLYWIYKKLNVSSRCQALLWAETYLRIK